MATDTTASLIIGRLDLSPIVDQLHHIQSMLDHLSKARNESEEIHDPIISKQVSMIYVNTKEYLGKIREVRHLSHPSNRPRRTALLMAAGLVTLGGALGAVFTHHHNSKQRDELEAKHNDMLHYVDTAARRIRVNTEHIRQLNDTIEALVLQEMAFQDRAQQQQPRLQRFIQREALASLAQHVVTQATSNIHFILNTCPVR